jgi:hypothetical protein
MARREEESLLRNSRSNGTSIVSSEYREKGGWRNWGKRGKSPGKRLRSFRESSRIVQSYLGRFQEFTLEIFRKFLWKTFQIRLKSFMASLGSSNCCTIAVNSIEAAPVSFINGLSTNIVSVPSCFTARHLCKHKQSVIRKS